MVIVDWEDITSNTEPWLHMDDIKDLTTAKMSTIAWLVEDRVDSIILISTIGDDEEVGDINCIPKSTISSMRYIVE